MSARPYYNGLNYSMSLHYLRKCKRQITRLTFYLVLWHTLKNPKNHGVYKGG